MVDITVRGAEQLHEVAKQLKAAGDRELRSELYRGLNRATKPLKADAKKSAGSTLPKRGGLAKRVAKSRLSTKRRTGRNPGVRITAAGMTQLPLMDEGRVRHPVYGRGRWVTQSIKPGWFTDPMEAGADEVRRELVKVIDDIIRKLER